MVSLHLLITTRPLRLQMAAPREHMLLWMIRWRPLPTNALSVLRTPETSSSCRADISSFVENVLSA